MPDELVRVSVRGAGRVARELRGARRALQNDLIAEIRELGRVAEQAYEDHVLEDTGHAKSTIRAIPFFRASRPRVRVTIDAERDGFNYLRAMRFGQRVARIYPTRARSLAVHLHGRDEPPTHMGSVQAFRPTTDWVEDANREIDVEVERSTRALGRRVETRFR